MRRRSFLVGSVAASGAAAFAQTSYESVVTKSTRGKLRAGAARSNITPLLGASLAGNFTDKKSTDIHDELWVKSLVLDNGQTRVALAVCDLCVLPPEVVAEAKQMVTAEAQIPSENLVIACTHTHSAPPTMHLFQCQADPKYLEWLSTRIADSVRLAVQRLEPARLGTGFGREETLAFNRRYYLKSGTMPPNPFGGIDVVRTNPGIRNPNVIKPAGPIDPTVGVLAVEREDGSPICVVGNYSLHYVGDVGPGHVSADYFGYWADAIQRVSGKPFVAILTNGCQGDINNVDVFSAPQQLPRYAKMRQVADALAAESCRAWRSIEFRDEVELGGSREWLELGVRLPSADEAGAARKVLASLSPGELTQSPHVYARETVIMAETYPKTAHYPVQALRIGNTGVAAFSGEPFVELGLEMRKRSPFQKQILIGLANDHLGYLPTVRAHEEGGYETWRAKTSYLEKEAAPKVTAAMLRRLESLAG